MLAACCWLKGEGGKYTTLRCHRDIPRHSKETTSRVKAVHECPFAIRGYARPAQVIDIHGRGWSVSTSTEQNNVPQRQSSHRPYAHLLDRLDLKVEGNQGKDKALHDGAQRKNCGPDVVKLTLRSCTR